MSCASTATDFYANLLSDLIRLAPVQPPSLQARLERLLHLYGETYSHRLGIHLQTQAEPEIFKWFLAALLFGTRISETIAMNTYRAFQEHRVLTPQQIQDAGWDRLVAILDAGGYVRYDFKTATKLLDITRDLLRRYSTLTALHHQARDPRDLETRLMALGKGIGPVTTTIFLRELRDLWAKADPLPQDLETLAARHLQLAPRVGATTKERRRLLQDLQHIWTLQPVQGKGFTEFEVALVRLGKMFCRRNRVNQCPFQQVCRPQD